MLDDMSDITADYCKTGSTILLGHSMGSFLAQQFVTRFGDQLNALDIQRSLYLGWDYSQRGGNIAASELTIST